MQRVISVFRSPTHGTHGDGTTGGGGREARGDLGAALELFGRYGYRRTSIDDIARQAGIAKGTVYLYVENKESLFRTLSQTLLDGVLANARAAATAAATIAARSRPSSTRSSATSTVCCKGRRT
jgi:AcrR family transcriptional regulator